MRTFRVLLVSFIVLFWVGSIAISGNNAIGEEKEIEKVTLKVEGMKISCCAEKVQSALKEVPGVKIANISLEKKEAVVEFEKGKVTLAQLIEAVKKAGYKALLALEETVFQVEGMMGPKCSTKVQSALQKIPGVKKVEVSFESKEAVVEFEREKVTSTQLIESIKEVGYQASLALEKTVLEVGGMKCSKCEAKVQSALLQVPGVKTADVSFDKKEAVIEFEKGKVTTDQLIEAVKAADYQAAVVEKH